MLEKGVLLIGGCPRSGTTAAYHLLSEHPYACITNERYFARLTSSQAIRGDEFASAERFFDFRADDSYPQALARAAGRGDLREKFDRAQVVGDKVPPLYYSFDRLREVFPQARILMLFRNLHDVGASYQKRADNPEDVTWPADKGWRQAIGEWNDSLALTLAAMDKGSRILPMPYERLFSEKAVCDAMFAFFGLAPSPLTDSMFEKLNSEYLSYIAPRRERHLDSAAAAAIEREMDRARYDQLRVRSEELLFEGAAPPVASNPKPGA